MTWHQLLPADDAVFDSATSRVHHFSRTLSVGADAVWDALTSDASIGAWRMPPGLSIRARWTTRRPFGVGTTREVTLPTHLVLRERFYRWDAGERQRFAVTAVNRPGLQRFAEDYTIATRADGGAR